MFCSNCGKQIPENTKFCNYCGVAQGQNLQADAAVNTQNAEVMKSLEGKAKKKITKKMIGIILLCLQVVAILGTVANGEFNNLMQNFTGPMGIAELVGFFLPTIIGVILLIVDNKNNRKNK